jgi:hypothetical protein
MIYIDRPYMMSIAKPKTVKKNSDFGRGGHFQMKRLVKDGISAQKIYVFDSLQTIEWSALVRRRWSSIKQAHFAGASAYFSLFRATGTERVLGEPVYSKVTVTSQYRLCKRNGFNSSKVYFRSP